MTAVFLTFLCTSITCTIKRLSISGLGILKKIDFEYKIVYFENDCSAVFARKYKQKPKGWVGPADPLEFKKSNCEIEYPQ